jgi:hypothetical protein
MLLRVAGSRRRHPERLLDLAGEMGFSILEANGRDET